MKKVTKKTKKVWQEEKVKLLKVNEIINTRIGQLTYN
jgi:hypothetical protein